MRDYLKINTPAPNSVQTDFQNLRQNLDMQIPLKRDRENLVIGTWNIRSFSSLTRKWLSASGDSPRRDVTAIQTITEIISRFDIVAIQEVSGDLRALRDTLELLGSDWSFLMTDITLGDQGNSERLAFIFDRRRVQPSGLACELVIPPEWKDDISPGALQDQFARTPYAVSFRSGDVTFILVTLHVRWGKKDETDEVKLKKRAKELDGIAKWMAEWADRTTKWHHNFVVLGDFNIDRRDDKLWKAFTSTGLSAPQQLNNVRRTIFDDPSDSSLENFYDQIAWFNTDHRALLNMQFADAGGFDFLPFVYTGQGLSKNSISFRISDHYPLWAEFQI